MAIFGKSAADSEELRKMNTDDLLDALGLMRKSEESSWVMPAIGGIALGLVCGVALGMAFAPKRGSELRSDVADKLKNKDFGGIAHMAREAIGSGSTGASTGTTVPPGSTRGGSTVI